MKIEPAQVDFDTALASLQHDPSTVDGNGGEGALPNGLLDSAEMALVAAVLSGEVQHAEATAVRAAWSQALASAEDDLQALIALYPLAPTVVAGYAMVGTPESLNAIGAMTAAFGAPLQGDYSLAAELGRLFSPEGDADGDGASNRQEYAAAISSGIEAYVAAALDPAQTPDPSVVAEAPAAVVAESPRKKRVGVILFPGFEVLDVYGPVEMWAYVGEFEILMIAETAGPVTSAQGIATVATHSFESAPELDLLLVPGGIGTFAAEKQPAMLDFLRQRHEEAELTTSVCTGSLLLAATGILDGRRATSNKLVFEETQRTSDRVHWVREARWVDDGDITTSSGVSAGIDMALAVVARLYGEERAEQIATWTEYVWNRDSTLDPFVGSIRPSREPAAAKD
ncbi:MAG: DJ-1/PfpI family protein [Acidobacteriota bacterium]